MAKKKAPAPKGGKKPAAPAKKVAKKAIKRAIAKGELAVKQGRTVTITARQADQAVADKLQQERFDSVKAAFDAPQPEQYLGGVRAEMVDAGKMYGVAPPLRSWTAYVDSLPPAPPKKPSRWARFRSAISGLFVSKSYAEANPHTTVKERAE